MFNFYTPTTDYPMSDGPLFGRYRRPVGMSVLQDSNGAWRIVEIPSEDDITSAVRVFLGGHVHLVSDETAAELSAAGFGEGLVSLP